MKHIKAILIFVLAIGLLAGCSSSQVKLIEEEGSYYLQVKTPYSTQSDEASQIIAPAIYFDTIEEMLDDIRTGTFTDEEMKELVRFDRDEQDRVILFDMNNVLEPVYPSDYDSYNVFWEGSSYYYHLINTSTGRTDVFYEISAEYYTEWTEYYNNYDQQHEFNHIATENREGVEVTIYDYDAGNEFRPDPYRVCIYTLSNADTELLIYESYDADTDLQTPTRIKILGESGDVYFFVIITPSTTRPSPHWFLDFDLKPYTARPGE